MINFFRKIRQQLLGEGKNAKYFKYAIGEILLVMIGILLALQVNNWNERRKIEKDINQLISNFEIELIDNINNSNGFLQYGYHLDSINTLFYNGLVTPQMIRKSQWLIRRNFGTNTIDFLEDRLNELIDVEKQLSSKYKTIIPDLKQLKFRIESQKYWEAQSLQMSLKRTDELINNYSWYGRNDSISFERAIKHAMTDSIYFNKVNAYVNLQLNENVWDATLIRTSSIALLWKIKNIRKESNTPEIRTFLNDLNLEPFREISCDSLKAKSNEIFFRRNFVLYNNSLDTVRCSFLNDSGNEFYNFLCPPKQFKLSELWLDTNEYIQFSDEEGCEKLYNRFKEDYVVIE